MFSRLLGSNLMMEAEVFYYLERVKEMLLAAMIITTTLILPFLLRFYSHLIVHFVFGTFYTSGMLPPETKKCFDSLAWITTSLIWLPYCNCEFPTFLPLRLTSLRFHFCLCWREFPQISPPPLSRFIFLFSHEARAGRELGKVSLLWSYQTCFAKGSFSYLSAKRPRWLHLIQERRHWIGLM